MSKKVILVLLVLVLILVLAAPVVAVKKERIGGQVSIFPNNETTTYPAGTDFYIAHGWSFSFPDDWPVPGTNFDFKLYVNGSYQPADFLDNAATPNPGGPPGLAKVWVHNFPGGKTGSHTFKGEWYAPCAYAVEQAIYPGPCTKPTEKVLTSENTATVTFVP